MDNISIFGANGFIGSHYKNVNPTDSIPMERFNLEPDTNEILWFISTVDNYHVFNNLTIDIYTNQLLFMEMLTLAKIKYGKDFTVNFISSWFVYGKQDILPVKEDAICNPTGFYSITKRAAEQLLISFCETFGAKYRIVRLGNVLGVGDKKISKKKNAVQYMIKRLIDGEEIYLYETPSIRDFIDVRDCVNIIHKIVNSGKINEIYNVGNGIPINVNELMYYAWNKINNGNIIEIPVPEFHKTVQATEFYLDIQKLPLRPQIPLYSTIDWIIGDYANNK